MASFPKACKPCRHLVSIIRECELRLMLSERMTIYMILAISSEFTLIIDTYLRFEAGIKWTLGGVTPKREWLIKSNIWNSNICKPEEGWYGQPKYCYEKTMHVVLNWLCSSLWTCRSWWKLHELRSGPQFATRRTHNAAILTRAIPVTRRYS